MRGSSPESSAPAPGKSNLSVIVCVGARLSWPPRGLAGAWLWSRALALEDMCVQVPSKRTTNPFRHCGCVCASSLCILTQPHLTHFRMRAMLKYPVAGGSLWSARGQWRRSGRTRRSTTSARSARLRVAQKHYIRKEREASRSAETLHPQGSQSAALV